MFKKERIFTRAYRVIYIQTYLILQLQFQYFSKCWFSKFHEINNRDVGCGQFEIDFVCISVYYRGVFIRKTTTNYYSSFSENQLTPAVLLNEIETLIESKAKFSFN